MSQSLPRETIEGIRRDVAEWARLTIEWEQAWDEKGESPEMRLLWERVDHRYRTFKPEFSGDWEARIAGGIRNDAYSRECAIAFLEVDSKFHRSGYTKAKFTQRLSGAPLSDEQKGRLQAVLLDAVLHRPGREYRRYCRLAARIADPKLREELARLSDESGPIAARARMMLEYAQA